MALIKGTVTDLDGNPLSWVGVIIDPDDKINRKITLTNSKGKFGFDAQPGYHTIRLRSPYLQPFTEQFYLEQDGHNIEATLRPALRMLDFPSKHSRWLQS